MLPTENWYSLFFERDALLYGTFIYDFMIFSDWKSKGNFFKAPCPVGFEPSTSLSLGKYSTTALPPKCGQKIIKTIRNWLAPNLSRPF